MVLPRKILILLHARDVKAERRPYVVWSLAEVWRRAGVEVEVVRGVERFVDADVAISHIALTVVPEEYRRYLRRYPVAVNGGAVDASKAVVSQHLVRAGDGYQGPVIVKTNLNYGGLREEELLDGVPVWQRIWRRVRRLRPLPAGNAWATVRTLDPSSYPVFGSLAEVPPAIFANPALVVEKFLPEREGELYALRSCVFFGDRHLNVRTLSPEPVVKATSARREEIAPHPEVFSGRARLALDYGKLDYVVRDGAAVLFDANRNPAFGSGGSREFQQRAATHLAAGLGALWPAR